MKLKVLIIDDEKPAREILKSYVKKLDILEFKSEAKNALVAHSVLSKENIDLVFLDIDMPGVSGLEFLRTLTRRPTIVFTTAHRKYAYDGFEEDVADFLLKPISFSRFIQSVNKALQKVRRMSDSRLNTADKPDDLILLYSNKTFHQINREQILYLKSDQDYIEIHLDGGKRTLINTSLDKLEKQLEAFGFMRVHRSFIVALKQIEKFTSTQIWIRGNQIPIGTTYRQSFKKRFESMDRLT